MIHRTGWLGSELLRKHPASNRLVLRCAGMTDAYCGPVLANGAATINFVARSGGRTLVDDADILWQWRVRVPGKQAWRLLRWRMTERRAREFAG